ncbi:hypothetical protein BT69DRAFT_1357764 [Atractiella rhizophila]|nr:hypothetical protein BT69DRAFT_1357764 [Atractiella rhizophila]
MRKIKPPFKPTVESPADVSNIDAEFLAEQPVDSVVKSSGLSESFQRQFEGFTYEDNEMAVSR